MLRISGFFGCMRIIFHGAARTVTGANFLLESGRTKLLVDCGLIQGEFCCEDANFHPFPYEPGKISAVFVTHAHLDHIGRLPNLVKEGFEGKIYSTAPTRDLALLSLEDSIYILAEEAERRGRQPLFNEEDVSRLEKYWEVVDYEQELNAGKDISVRLLDAGHILGSSFVEITSQGKTIVITGDIGNPPTPLLRPPTILKKTDFVVMESAYGNRMHEDKERRRDILEDAIEDTVKSGGVVMIPSFAMERTQELLYELNELVEHNRIPRIPIFIDSPLAIKMTEVYKKYPQFYNQEARYLISKGDDLFKFPGLKFTVTTEESKAINDIPPPKIVIAGSGMSQGGRILHHERRYLSDPASLFLVIGYQAAGSLGRRILEGANEVRIFGERVSVRARHKAIGGYSAHADQQGLREWVAAIPTLPKEIFVVQGEEAAALSLAQVIRDELAIKVAVPQLGESFELW